MQPAGLDSLNSQSLFSVVQPWLPFPIGWPTNPTTFSCLSFPLCQIQRFLFSALKCFEIWHREEQGSLSSCVGPDEGADWSLKDKQQLFVWLFFLYTTRFCWTHKTQEEAAEMLFSFMPGTCLLFQGRAKESRLRHSSANPLHLYWLIGHNPILVKT